MVRDREHDWSQDFESCARCTKSRWSENTFAVQPDIQRQSLSLDEEIEFIALVKMDAVEAIAALLKGNPFLVFSRDERGGPGDDPWPIRGTTTVLHEAKSAAMLEISLRCMYSCFTCLYSDRAQALQEYQAQINEGDSNSKTPLQRWAYSLKDPAIFELLLANGAHINTSSKYDTPLLHCVLKGIGSAAKIECASAARMLIANGADVHARDDYGDTPLHVTAGYGEVSKLLLENGADPNAKNKVGSTPLHRTAGWESAKLLLESGADPNAKNSDLSTPLHRAAEMDDPRHAKLLIDHGADVNAVARGGESPLHVAACRNRWAWNTVDFAKKGPRDVIELLLENRADATIRDSNGQTALDMVLKARDYKTRREVIEMLQAATASK
jgi:ankyrin repeat protein